MALEIEQFKATQIYSPTATSDVILGDIAQLRQFDKEMEAELFRWLMILIGSVIAAIACFFLATGQQGLPQLVLLIIGGIGVIGAIFAGIMRWQLGSYDLEDRRYNFLDGLLRLVSRDMGKEQSLKVRLDLRAPNHQSKHLHDAQIGIYHVKHYVDPWLELEGRLADGTLFSLEAIEKFQVKGKYTGYKNKWKEKNRSATELILVLRPKESKYSLVEELGRDLFGALRIPPWCQLKLMHLQDGELWLRVTTKAEWEAPSPDSKERPMFNGVDIAAMMFLSLYQVLNLSRKIRNVQRGGGQE